MTDTLGLGANGRFVLLLIGGLAGTVAIGSVSYQLVERPLLKLKRLVPGRPRPTEAIAEPAPATPVTAK
jgi:peptidoglycan/LPS O-acetylase OafA/YrhL